MRTIIRFFQREDGQDLIEYSLLLGFLALASAGLFVSSGNSVAGIWSMANTTLSRNVSSGGGNGSGGSGGGGNYQLR